MLLVFGRQSRAAFDNLIALAESHGPIKRKYSVKVQPNPKTEFGKKLASVLDRN